MREIKEGTEEFVVIEERMKYLAMLEVTFVNTVYRAIDPSRKDLIPFLEASLEMFPDNDIKESIQKLLTLFSDEEIH